MRAAAWSPLAFVVLFLCGWIGLARFLPPLSPALSATEVADLVTTHRTSFMLAAVLIMVSTVVVVPCSALILMLIRKIEGRAGILTLMMGFTLTTNLVSNFFTGFFLSAAAFRADRGPEVTQLAMDLAVLLIMGGIPLFWLVFAILAYALIVVNPREEPLAPRWVGYANLWITILFLPELLVFFFKTGPFAWNGIVGFWIPATCFVWFFILLTVMFVPMTRRKLL